MAPQTQTAVVIEATGPTDVLKLVHDFPVPKRGSGEVLIRIHSTSVYPVDTQVRDGYFQPKSLPKVLGGDVAGVVEEADETSKFKLGDPVFAPTKGFWHETPDGSYCQYASVPEDWCASIPASLPINQAGGVPLVGLTAWQALHMEGTTPQPGQRLLVMEASGCVGHMAVQLGKALGMYVVGVAGPDNQDFVSQLGADEVVNYKEAEFDQVYSSSPFDLVIDMLPNNIAKCVKVLKPSGHLSHIQNKDSDHSKLQQLQQAHEGGQQSPSAGLVFVTPNGQQLQAFSDLIAQGKVKLVVHRTFPLSEVAKAHKLVGARHTKRGKVVLQVE